jgi:flagellar secretion chaperone FliS
MSSVRQLQVYKDNQISTADPGTILLMLYEGAIDALKRASQHLAANDMAEKGRYILRAHDIITQFIVSLDYDVGGELARNLEGLYRYMLEQILVANVENDPGRLAEVISLLCTLKDGWESAVVAQRKRVAQGGL